MGKHSKKMDFSYDEYGRENSKERQKELREEAKENKAYEKRIEREARQYLDLEKDTQMKNAFSYDEPVMKLRKQESRKRSIKNEQKRIERRLENSPGYGVGIDNNIHDDARFIMKQLRSERNSKDIPPIIRTKSKIDRDFDTIDRVRESIKSERAFKKEKNDQLTEEFEYNPYNSEDINNELEDFHLESEPIDSDIAPEDFNLINANINSKLEDSKKQMERINIRIKDEINKFEVKKIDLSNTEIKEEMRKLKIEEKDLRQKIRDLNKVHKKYTDFWMLEFNHLNTEIQINLGKQIILLKINHANHKKEEMNKQIDNVNLIYNRAISLKRLGQFEEAKVYYDQLLRLDPDNIKILNSKGILLGEMHRYSEAFECIDKSLKINPKSHYIWDSKGTLYMGVNKFKEAIACYDRALKINPEKHISLINKGLALEKLGKIEEAKNCFKQAEKIQIAQDKN